MSNRKFTVTRKKSKYGMYFDKKTYNENKEWFENILDEILTHQQEILDAIQRHADFTKQWMQLIEEHPDSFTLE